MLILAPTTRHQPRESADRDGACSVRPVESSDAGPVRLTGRFAVALSWAAALHGDQRRKSSEIPYLSHLLAVSALVLEDGGNEEEAIAALLHDAIEDSGAALADFEAALGAELGARVYRVVEGCSDRAEDPDAPRDASSWDERKTRYLEHLADPSVAESVLRISVADKLHNARTILSGLRENGAALWDRFNAGEARQLWYYRSLVDVLTRRYPRPITRELASRWAIF